MSTHVVIMAGGIGSRLWPVSTPRRPKQFIDLLGTGKTLLQMTVDRFKGVATDFWVVTSASYVPVVRAQLPSLPEDRILAEPVGRSTAPCIAYACWKILKRYPDANVVVTPADAYVSDTGKFAEAVSTAVKAVSQGGKIVTIGIRPTRPETGYGYICASSAEEGKVVKVSEFKEKPSLQTAEQYLSAGNYFWNAGIFVWNVATVISEIRAHAPSIAAVMDALAPSFYTPAESSELARLFPTCENISIDYAVMEKSDNIYVIAADPGWSDLGSWDSLRQQIPADEMGNSVVGSDVRLFECKGCIVHSSDSETVVVQGLENCIVAASGGRLLVCSIPQEQRIKEFSAPKS